MNSSVTPLVKHPPSLSMNPASIILDNNGSAVVTLTVSTNSNTTQGSGYTITVEGTSGTESTFVQIELTVIP